jgi:hypothetical protein
LHGKDKKKSEKISTLYDFFQKYGEIDRYSGINVDFTLGLRDKILHVAECCIAANRSGSFGLPKTWRKAGSNHFSWYRLTQNEL